MCKKLFYWCFFLLCSVWLFPQESLSELADQGLYQLKTIEDSNRSLQIQLTDLEKVRLIDLVRLENLSKLSEDMKRVIKEDQLQLTQLEKISKDQLMQFQSLERSFKLSKLLNKVLLVAILGETALLVWHSL